MYVCIVMTYSRESIDQPGNKIANPARGQLNRENELLFVSMYTSVYLCIYACMVITYTGSIV